MVLLRSVGRSVGKPTRNMGFLSGRPIGDQVDELQEAQPGEEETISHPRYPEPQAERVYEAPEAPVAPRRSRAAVWAAVILIVLATAIGGGAGALLASSMATTFRSEAIVVPVNVSFPIGQFPVLAQAVFRTDAVIQPVITKLALDTSPHELLTSGLLSIEEIPTGGAVDVVGTTRDATLSQDLANAGAHSLAQAMESNNVGTLSVFAADAPGEEQPKPIVAYAIIGAVAGLVVAIGLLLAVRAIRSLRASVRSAREAPGYVP